MDSKQEKFLKSKNAELGKELAQKIRYLEIEAALERVRSRTMAMQSSDELAKTVSVLFKELLGLGIKPEQIRTCGIVTFNTHEPVGEQWITETNGEIIPQSFMVPYDEAPAYKAIYEAWKNGEKFKVIHLEGEPLKRHLGYLAKYTKVPVRDIVTPQQAKEIYNHVLYFSQGCLFIITKEALPEYHEVFKRFGAVFQQSYTRFLDLKKSEAQAREAQIELALERVRARTMAMYHSEELAETAAVLFEQLSELGNEPARIAIWILDQEKEVVNFWATDQEGDQINISFKARINEQTTISKMYAGWKEKMKSLSIDLQGEELAAWVSFCREEMGIIMRDDLLKKRRVHTVGYFSQGWINYTTHDPLSAETIKILERFSAVFDHTYTRFLDLQKAEAQAREAQIELALERVRARTMAMQKSEELAETAYILFQQFKELGENPDQATIGIINKEEWVIEYWVTMYGSQINKVFKFSIDEPNVTNKIYKAWKKQQKSLVIDLSGKELYDFTTYRASMGGAAFNPDEQRRIINVAFFSKGLINVQSSDIRSAESIRLLERFAGVFEQTYTRFLDLKKAEEQAREAKIEAALERTRTQSMLMQHSNELDDTLRVFHQQVLYLGIHSAFSFLWLPDEQKDRHIFWAAWAEDDSKVFKSKAIDYPLDRNELATAQCLIDWKGNIPVVSYHVPPDGVESYFAAWQELIDGVEQLKPEYFTVGLYYVEAFMKYGCFGVMVESRLAEDEKKILGRFAIEFERTYTRFLDLQKAEGQAREAQIEAALEKVRSRSLAMHNTDELQEVVNLVFEKLQEMGMAMDSVNISIPDEKTKSQMIWIAVNGIPYPQPVLIPDNDDPISSSGWEAWFSQVDYFSRKYSFEEKNQFYNWAFEHSSLKYMPPERKAWVMQSDGCAYSIAFGKVSAIWVVSYSGLLLNPNEAETLKRFGRVFEQAYVRFLDLQKAEAQARESQIQLALERVRARTMAMQKSEELAETATVLFQQLLNLGISSERTFIGMPNDVTRKIELWGTEQGGHQMSTRFEYEADATYAFREIYKAWQEKRSELTVILKGKDLAEHVNYVRNVLHMPLLVGLVQKQRILYNAFFSKSLLMIVTPDTQSKETLEILKRFAGVFDGTYTRFLDLQRAEEQAREAQIELSLERVRAKTMAMHSSSDVADTAAVMFDELVKLGVERAVRCGIGILTRGSSQIEVWTARAGENEKPELIIGHFDTNIHPLLKGLYNAWHKHEHSFSYVLADDDRIKYYESINSQPGYPIKYDISQLPSPQYNSDFFFAEGVLYAFTSQPLSDEISSVFKRFAGVFGQTYRRYLDLQKAEAQAREAQIEAALERVRSKTMAMHSSADVADTVAVMFNELIKLGVEKSARCGIAVLDEARMMELWTARLSENERADLSIGHIDMNIHPLLMGVHDAWKNKESSFSYELAGDELSAYITAINNYPGYPIRYDINSLGSKQFNSDFFFPEGMLFVFTSQPFDEAISSIFKRFAGVFGQTYRRYLDLLKAEAAAREAQIEAALERVRSKTMAMHNSQDVGDTVGVMFHEFVKLGIEKMIRCGIGIMSHENRTMELWTAKWGENEKINLLIGHLDMTIHKMLGSIYDAWESKQSDFTYHLAGSDLVTYAKVINSYPDYPLKYDLNSLPPAQFFNDFSFNEGVVFAFTSNPLSDEIVTVLKRFAGVFGQTYRRYLDLQKAENQAREAQIEAALERVRSKAMAMRSSGDLNDTANTVFIELRKLGVDLVRCGLGLIEKETHISTIHAATNSAEGGSLEVLGNIDMHIHPVFEGIYNQWLQNKDYFPVLEEESLKTYYEKLQESGISVPEWKSGEKQYGYFLQFAYGSLYAWSGTQESEITVRTLKRFTSVISLTYTRYIELQKAESNTKEAIKQASLDRVRAEIASMRKQSDLERITPLIWDELTILGIPFIRCGVFIMDEEQELIHTFLSTPDGKAIGAFHIPFDTSGNFEIMVGNWRNKEPYIDHWKEEAFSQFANALLKQGAITSKAQYMRTLPHEGVHLNFLPFLQGMLYVGNIAPLAEDNIDLIQAVADAFSTAYARYEDFNKLEAAKQQVDNTLIDLKAAQTKLIQSEKMASLGELTAGIAHEIQNPLNFVNNFSEVNQEMIDELEEELKAGNIEEALAIAADIKQNEEKISHHGKRADGIVKGMLQHSRTGGGEKQLTNMNVLADEFLRLSYHGLRAKDKTFNADMVTHFDPDLPKISVIAQDMGRVLLNLFNNAFYAVNQKKKTAGADYKPEVSVTTSSEKGQVIIKVKDNGVGIPEHVKEKIMQPFFTTKPTGEGTGLGLSLTYDMVVKGHGGSIQVESTEGQGSEFIIILHNQI